MQNIIVSVLLNVWKSVLCVFKVHVAGVQMYALTVWMGKILISDTLSMSLIHLDCNHYITHFNLYLRGKLYVVSCLCSV